MLLYSFLLAVKNRNLNDKNDRKREKIFDKYARKSTKKKKKTKRNK